MDERLNIWNDRAAELEKIADGTADDTTRKSLLKLVDDYRQMANLARDVDHASI